MKKNTQVKNSFDYQTLQKIGKGALIAGTGAATLYILNAAGTIEAGGLTPLIGFLVPFLSNLVREYLKGEEITIVE